MAASGKILVYRLGSLGDALVAVPALRRMAEKFPSHTFDLLTNVPVSAKAAPMADVLGQAIPLGEVLAYPVGTRSPGLLASLAADLRRRRYRAIVDLNPARGRLKAWRDRLFFACCGAGQIVGSPLSARSQERRPVSTALWEREADRLLARIEEPVGSRPSHLLPEDREAADRLNRAPFNDVLGAPYVVLSIGTKLSVNDWGDERWAELIDRFSMERPDVGLVAIGAADETERTARLLSRFRGKTANGCGRLSVRESGELLRRARLFLGHDSGPMHLAAAAGTRVIGLFSWNNPPGPWFPLGSGHTVFYPRLPGGQWSDGLRMRKSDTEGVLRIKSGDVFRRALEVLTSRPETETHVVWS